MKHDDLARLRRHWIRIPCALLVCLALAPLGDCRTRQQLQRSQRFLVARRGDEVQEGADTGADDAVDAEAERVADEAIAEANNEATADEDRQGESSGSAKVPAQKAQSIFAKRNAARQEAQKIARQSDDDGEDDADDHDDNDDDDDDDDGDGDDDDDGNGEAAAAVSLKGSNPKAVAAEEDADTTADSDQNDAADSTETGDKTAAVATHVTVETKPAATTVKPAAGHVLYIIPSWHKNYHTRVAAVMKTWAKTLPASSLIIAGDEESQDPPVVSFAKECGDDTGGHGRTHVCRLATALVMAKQNLGNANWVFVADDDAYANTTNIEKALAKMDASRSILAGMWGCGRNQCPEEEDELGNLCGGGGFALSKAALQEMIGSSQGEYDNFKNEFTTLGTGKSWSTVYFGDLAASCLSRRTNVERVQLDGLNPFRLGGMGQPGLQAGKSSEKLPWGYVYAIHNANVTPLTFHYISPDEMDILQNEFARNSLPPVLNMITLGGFNHTELNGNYTRSTDPDDTIGDRATYWTDAGDFFMYYCRQFGRWTVARESEFQYINDTNGEDCHGMGSQPSGPMPEGSSNWLELMNESANQTKWIRRSHAGVRSFVTVKPQALVLLSTEEIHRQYVDSQN